MAQRPHSKMPYNTRRKSLSLPSMGIPIPSSRAHRSPPSTAAASATQQPSRRSNDAVVIEHTSPPSKRLKRSHPSASPPSVLQRRPSVKFHDERPSPRLSQQTPPPSPGPDDGPKVDTEGINDDVVVAVIEQLEKTGNRPHMLKELATILHDLVPVVQTSANPTAVISSRLTTYLRRPWTNLSPCPLSKELVEVHPRKVYFFLSGRARQEIPSASPSLPPSSRIISPSLSSDPDEEDDVSTTASEAIRRRQLSPSPELDLSSPDDMGDGSLNPDQNDGMLGFGSHSSHSRLHGGTGIGRHRGTSPQAEGVEREFEQMVSTLRRRSKSLSMERSRASNEPPSSTASSAASSASPPTSAASLVRTTSSTSTSTSSAVNSAADTSTPDFIKQEPGIDVELSVESDPDRMHLDDTALDSLAPESEESAALRNSEDAAALFGDAVISVCEASADTDVEMGGTGAQASPGAEHGDALGTVELAVSTKMGMAEFRDEWDDFRNPEAVEVEELEELFGEF